MTMFSLEYLKLKGLLKYRRRSRSLENLISHLLTKKFSKQIAYILYLIKVSKVIGLFVASYVYFKNVNTNWELYYTWLYGFMFILFLGSFLKNFESYFYIENQELIKLSPLNSVYKRTLLFIESIVWTILVTLLEWVLPVLIPLTIFSRQTYIFMPWFNIVLTLLLSAILSYCFFCIQRQRNYQGYSFIRLFLNLVGICIIFTVAKSFFTYIFSWFLIFPLKAETQSEANQKVLSWIQDGLNGLTPLLNKTVDILMSKYSILNIMVNITFTNSFHSQNLILIFGYIALFLLFGFIIHSSTKKTTEKNAKLNIAYIIEDKLMDFFLWILGKLKIKSYSVKKLTEKDLLILKRTHVFRHQKIFKLVGMLKLCIFTAFIVALNDKLGNTIVIQYINIGLISGFILLILPAESLRVNDQFKLFSSVESEGRNIDFIKLNGNSYNDFLKSKILLTKLLMLPSYLLVCVLLLCSLHLNYIGYSIVLFNTVFCFTVIPSLIILGQNLNPNFSHKNVSEINTGFGQNSINNVFLTVYYLCIVPMLIIVYTLVLFNLIDYNLYYFINFVVCLLLWLFTKIFSKRKLELNK